MRARAALAAFVLLAALVATTPWAVAAPPRPVGLEVIGGDGWHAENAFLLGWDGPPPGATALSVTRYRVRDAGGATIGSGTVNGLADGIGPLAVPGTPGAYSAEVWFEDASGAQGPAASAPLRFDDTRPGTVAPGPVPTWIGRASLPLRVSISHPDVPLPISGISGYAVAIDTDPEGQPCNAAGHCDGAATTLRDGIDRDELQIASLPDGIRYLHVAAVSGAGLRSAASGRAVLRVDKDDPVTRLSGAPAGWTGRSVRVSAEAVDDSAGMAPADGAPVPFTAIRVDDRAPVVGQGDRVATDVIEEGMHRVAYYARDAAGNVNDGMRRNGVVDRAPSVAWVGIDRTPPAVAFANSQDPTRPDLIRVLVEDPLSGPDTGRGWIGVRRAGSGDPFQRLAPAPPSHGELRAHWDSDAQPLGEYEFRATGYDAAGNSALATVRRNGAPMVLANPLKATTGISDHFNRHSLRRTVPYGRRVLLRGRLTTGLSTPLGGAPVRVVERFAEGARPAVRVSTVETRPSGAFRVRTAPGPSRTIALAFDGSPTLAASSGRTLELRVRSRVRLRASAGVARVGGAPLVFRGRVIAPRGAITKRGKAVQLQFRLHGLPWASFRTVRTDRRGRFRYAYRFSDDDSRGARFQFRAYAPAQDNWPYEPGGSRPVLVRGK